MLILENCGKNSYEKIDLEHLEVHQLVKLFALLEKCNIQLTEIIITGPVAQSIDRIINFMKVNNTTSLTLRIRRQIGNEEIQLISNSLMNCVSIKSVNLSLVKYKLTDECLALIEILCRAEILKCLSFVQMQAGQYDEKNIDKLHKLLTSNVLLEKFNVSTHSKFIGEKIDNLIYALEKDIPHAVVICSEYYWENNYSLTVSMEEHINRKVKSARF